MKFSFVVLTWNRYQFLEKCLDALVAGISDPEECEILVMDNGSTDRTSEVLKRYRHLHFVRVLRRRKNHGLNAYKRLFAAAQGKYIVEVDDDVLAFPAGVDLVFDEYMESYPDYGYIALNVVQDAYTNGARPGIEEYTEDLRDGKALLRGPTGGWCACFRKSEYQQIQKEFLSIDFHMGFGEDSFLVGMFHDALDLKSGVIRDAVCLHASGPYYAKQFGHLDREIEKYASANLNSFVEDYKQYLEE